LTKAEAAKMLDADPSLITRWVGRGMPLTSEAKVREWHAANVRTRRKQSEMGGLRAVPISQLAKDEVASYRPLETPVDLDGLNWRERKDRAQALSEEQKLAERKGELVERSVVLATWSTLVSAFRARMRAIPSKTAPQIAVPGKVKQAVDILEREIDEALAEVAGDGLPSR
jgi:phage terminase Nu1 subunit (DNA packaging protein)